MRVAADRGRCMASGACVLECPEVFAQDAEGVVVVLNEHPGEQLRDAVLAAADSCPAVCIEVDD